MANNIKFAFFGTPDFAVGVLDTLKEQGYMPSLIITTPDKPQGRHLELTPPPTKVWAEVHGIEVLQPEKLDAEFAEKLSKEDFDVFIVAAYGKLIPRSIFDLPKARTLNVHPSLLPKLRGASPMQSAILNEDETGITIMLIEEKMDVGDIVAQEKISIPEWPPHERVLEEMSAKHGGELLAKILPDWINGKITPVKQDESQVTFCKKIVKRDGLLDMSADAETNLRKVRAFSTWPGAYIFYTKKNGEEIRIVVKDAEIVDGKFTPTLVVPAGKKEMSWEDFLRGNN
jgi:methionyl-tRNA formyltransferase